MKSIDELGYEYGVNKRPVLINNTYGQVRQVGYGAEE